MSAKQYTVTGVKSGLGKYLHDNLSSSLGITRNNLSEILPQITSQDIVVHCAFNKKNNIDDYDQYLKDNIFLTQKLVDTGAKIIYISSVDVYSQSNTYSLFKKFGEAITNQNPSNLILRLPALIGPGMKDNHITKIISNNNSKITLSKESTFNYIAYKDVLNFVLSDQSLTLKGTYDFTTKSTVNLDTIQKVFKLAVQFGDYTYNTPYTFPNPISNVWGGVNKTSIESLKETFKITENE
jgi:nucleoside-diphosphate-sugar epimerase